MPEAKFCAKWTDPYVIVEVISDALYRIQLSEDKPSKVVHYDHLKPCRLRESANVDLVDELYGDVSVELSQRPVESKLVLSQGNQKLLRQRKSPIR